MGVDPITLGLGASVVSGLYGAYNQNQTNNRNLNAQQQQQAMMQGLVLPQMQMGNNPYAAQLMQLAGGLRAPSMPGQAPGGMAGISAALMAPGTQGYVPPQAQVQAQSQGQGLMPAWLNQALGRPSTASISPSFSAGFDGSSLFSPSARMAGESAINSNLSPFGMGPAVQDPIGIPEAGQAGGFLGMPPVQGAPASGLFSPQLEVASTYSPFMAQAPGAISASQIGGGGYSAFGNLGTAGFNAGQDGLMQMARRQLAPAMDAGFNQELAKQASGNSLFDNSALFGSLNTLDQRNINQQASALRGRNLSLGQFAGTGAVDAESQLRERMSQDLMARNAQLASSSYENAQGRAMQALGLQGQQQQALQNFQLQNAGLQQQAMQAYGQQALAAAGQANQASEFGLGQQMQANLANQTTGLQAALANMQMQGQFGLANQAAANQAGQFNAAQNNAQYQTNLNQGNIYNDYMLRLISGAAGIQQGQQGQNLQALGILGGVGVPQSAPSALPGAISDAGQMAMLYPFLRQLSAGGGAYSAPVPTVPQIPIGQIPQVRQTPWYSPWG